jgi:hypothetical protein
MSSVTPRPLQVGLLLPTYEGAFSGGPIRIKVRLKG